jgi:transposase
VTFEQAAEIFLRRSPYIGLAKTHLHHVAIATGTNITRLVAWLNGKTKAATRITAFRSLKPSISA